MEKNSLIIEVASALLLMAEWFFVGLLCAVAYGG